MDISKLHESIQSSNHKLEKTRKERLAAVKQFAISKIRLLGANNKA